LGSPGEHRAAGLGHESTAQRISERKKASKSHWRCQWTAGGQGLTATWAPLLGREKLWRAGIGGKARRMTQACVARARKPGEPHGRMRDATSPQVCWWRKPSRPGGTARAERAWTRAASSPKRAQARGSGHQQRIPTEGRSLRNPVEGARLELSRAAAKGVSDSGRCQHAAGGEDFGPSCARAGHDAPRHLVHARDDKEAVSGKGIRPGTLRCEVIPSNDRILDCGWWNNARRHARGLAPRAHRAVP